MSCPNTPVHSGSAALSACTDKGMFDMTMTHFLFDPWVFRREVVGQMLLLYGGNQDKFGGKGKENNLMHQESSTTVLILTC